MKLLLDESLSPKLVRLLQDLFPASESALENGLAGAGDRKILDYAVSHGFLLISTDGDFERLAAEVPGAKIVILRSCDYPTAIAADVLRRNAIRIGRLPDSRERFIRTEARDRYDSRASAPALMYASGMTASLLSTALLLAAAAAGAPQLPEKLDIEIELQTPIDEKATPANSEIAFKLIRDLKKDNAVLAPKGALGTARVTRFQKHSAVIRNVKRNYYMVGVRLLTLTTGEGAVPLGTNLETIRPTATNDYFIPYSHGPDRWGEFEQYRSLFTAPPPEPGESFIGVVREYLKIPKGLRMVFRTTGG